MESLEYIARQLKNRFKKLDIKKNIIVEENIIKIVDGTDYELKIAKKFYPDYEFETRTFDNSSEERKIFKQYMTDNSSKKRIKLEFMPDYLNDGGRLKNSKGKEIDVHGREK